MPLAAPAFFRKAAVAAALLLASTVAGFSQWWTITWDNDVDFTLADGITGASYAESEHTITSGQPWDGIRQKQDGKKLRITIEAGRKGSAPVASWFIDRLYFYEYGAIAKYTLKDNLPAELNFATSGTLTIEGNKYRVVIGQGHSSPYNNWWIGGRDLTGFCARLVMATNDGRYFIEAVDQNTFKISRSSIRRPDWMASVPGGRLLSELSLPGTHDSATYHTSSVANTWTVTQNFSILAQLNMGVRYLDVRLRYADNELKTYHGPVDLELPFSLLLKQTIDFLNAHPTETVVMAIKKEEDGGNDIAIPFLNALRNEDFVLTRYWLEDRLPALDQVRNRIVFIDRESCIKMGIQIPTWGKNTTFDSTGLVKFSVQDHYSFAATDLDEKVEDVNKQMNAALTGAGTTWYINFLSAAGWTKTPWGIAETVNPQVRKDLDALGSGRVGTMVVDFAGELQTPRIIENVVGRNP